MMAAKAVTERKALTGNEAVAYAVRLARVKVISGFPITPQTQIAEALASFVADGSLDAEYVRAEGEHPMVAQVAGAAITGVRVFTSTSSQGLLFGYENLVFLPGTRLPVVVAIVNRSVATPVNIYPDYADSMSLRDHGWVQIYVETNQEALDATIQAYRIAEDQRVLMPTMVCLDGQFISGTTEIIEVPAQEEVDEYLPPHFEQKHIIMDPDNPMEFIGIVPPEFGMASEVIKNDALMRAKGVIQEANEEFERKFGRRYGNGLVEMTECDDAEVVLVTMGSMTSEAKLAIRELRKEGKPVGLVRVRSFRPFPKEDFLSLGKNVKAIAVVDRHLSKGFGEGACVSEVRSTLFNQDVRPKVLGFSAGLYGEEILISDFKYMAERAFGAVKSKKVGFVENEMVPTFEIKHTEMVPAAERDQLLFPGTTSCPGCGMALVTRHLINTLGKNISVVRTAGCQAWQSTISGKTLANLAFGRSTLPSGGAFATGLSRGYKIQGREDIEVLLLGGDGCVGDMGFLALSGAAQRNEDFLCVVYDNEAYANTGIQASGTTPLFAWTTTSPVGSVGRGKDDPRKSLPLIVAAHRVPYVATASIAYLDDFEKKLRKAMERKGFRYIHVYTPCPTSWRYSGEKTIKMARLGVESGINKLFEIEEMKLKMTYRPAKLIPVREFLEGQGRFGHLTEQEKEAFQKEVSESWDRFLNWEQSNLDFPFDSA